MRVQYRGWRQSLYSRQVTAMNTQVDGNLCIPVSLYVCLSVFILHLCVSVFIIHVCLYSCVSEFICEIFFACQLTLVHSFKFLWVCIHVCLYSYVCLYSCVSVFISVSIFLCANISVWVFPLIFVDSGTLIHIFESCHRDEWITSHVRMRPSRRTYEWDNHVARTNEAHHASTNGHTFHKKSPSMSWSEPCVLEETSPTSEKRELHSQERYIWWTRPYISYKEP